VLSRSHLEVENNGLAGRNGSLEGLSNNPFILLILVLA